MDLLVKNFKLLLGIKDVETDEAADKELERDVCDYAKILSSSKFANTNSNTDAIQRLMLATNSDDPTSFSRVNTAGWYQSDKAKTPTEDIKLVIAEPNVQEPDNKEPNCLMFDNKQPVKFKDCLKLQLGLIKELQGEYGEVLPGQPVYEPAKFGKQNGTNFVLRRFDIPEKVWIAMEFNSTEPLDLQSTLTSKNYVNRYQTLLWIEEAHQSIEMRRYDMKDVMLANYDGDSFLLSVPGLAEGRPSLMRGDKLVLKSRQRSTYYEGFIHDVRERDVKIKLHHSLHHASTEGNVFDVSFISSRTPFRRCHHSITSLKKSLPLLNDVAFPIPKINFPEPKIEVNEEPENLRLFMKNLNTYQRLGVINALKNQCRPSPYILFGPPGTGKTVTLVEIAFQIYARLPKSKILICANSNASTDLIAERISAKKLIPKDELVRVAAFYRFQNDLIPPQIKDITLEMDAISSEMFSKYRVVITTCIQAGCLCEFTDRFDYVLIDEAGHANEPEALIPINLMNRNGCCILAGDPHQLGPVCFSQVAKNRGLGTSLLERLAERVVYQQKSIGDEPASYDPKYITKLLISYRSDPRVMKICNDNFYKGELLFRIKTPKKWLDTVGATNPLIFHPVKGKDRREYINPSWFNANEAIRCLTYVNTLYRAGLKPNQLGIITPYRRQIEKLNTLFDSVNLKRCKVATMEEFQGDEREVIIISTVRTRPKNLEFDQQFKLGFLFDQKRFNVGISRAKWLVIVVGDPEILKRDELWNQYMEKAQTLGAIEEPKDIEK